MDFSQPPPVPMPGGPPPNLSMPPPSFHPPHVGFNQRPPFRPFMKPLPGNLSNMTLEDFDGKRLRKSVMRKTVDYNSSIIKALENRIWQRDFRDRRALQPDPIYTPDLMPPPSYPDNPINCVTSRFVKTATNKMRCPIFCMAWTPEGRRLVTGASSGEFTLWNGLTFNFETILQAHDSPVRTMVWSHNDNWMVTGDHAGYVKYWQSNMNNVKMFQAHKEALRGISFSPADTKFVTCSDDGTLRIWDFLRYQEERVLRGHGADVKCVHWHPQKSLIISGSKDNQQPIKLWDPKTGQSLATLHAHKSTVMDLKWNENGNWLITASRDHLLKLFDLRNLSQEVQTFRGHKKEASSVAWHPIHEGLFASGGSDGAIMFWHVGTDKELGAIEQAHDSIVWTLAWHPLGHILCSGSNDHTSKFWTRNRPGDSMRDKYNLNTLPQGIAGFEDIDVGDDVNAVTLPGMGPEDKVEVSALIGDETTMIPGFDLDSDELTNEEKPKSKKVPFSKPIPKNFQASWNTNDDPSGEMLSNLAENTPGAIPLEKLTPNAIVVYGKVIPVEPGSQLEKAISEGPEALQAFIDSGEIEELNDVMPMAVDVDDDFLNDDFDDDKKMPGLFDQDYRDMDMRVGQKKDSDLRAFQQGGPPAGFKGGMDFRPAPPNQNFISDEFGDEDFRNNGPRNKFPPPKAQDYGEDFEDRYYDEEPPNNFKNWSPSGAPPQRPPANFNNFRGGFNNPPPFRGRGMPGPRGSFTPRTRPPSNFGPSNGNFGPGGPNNGNFGSPRPPNSSNFEPNNSKFGPPSSLNSSFESNNSKFGPPPSLNSNFESNNSKFGPPSGLNSNYGRPGGPKNNFGPPSGPNRDFGPPSGSNRDFGPPSGPNNNFGPPGKPNSNFGPPGKQNSNFGPPDEDNWEENKFDKDSFEDNLDYSGDPQDYGPPPPKASRGRGRGRGGAPPKRGARGGPRGRARGGRGRGNRGRSS